MYSKVAKGTTLPHFTEAAQEGDSGLDTTCECVKQHSPDLVAVPCLALCTVATYKPKWSPGAVTAQRRYRSHPT